MLDTPFGNIIIKLNGIPIDYTIEELPLKFSTLRVENLFTVSGRYKLTPNLSDKRISFPLYLGCYANATKLKPSNMSGIESGERLWLVTLYSDKVKMSIGAYDDLDGIEGNDGTDFDDEWEKLYDKGNTETGIEIFVSRKEMLPDAYFCVSWMYYSDLKKNKENIYKDFSDDINSDNSTWFASDPSYI
jgi:hypothetical protein